MKRQTFATNAKDVSPEQSAMHVQHTALKEALRTTEEKRRQITSALTTLGWSQLVDRLKTETKEQMFELLTIDKKNFEDCRARICAKRDLILELENAYVAEVETAQTALTAFESKNPLFLQVEDTGADMRTGEIKESAGQPVAG